MKKFKSPEYVRKHILSKHNDKIEKVKFDVIYFNNFVKSKYKNLPFGLNLLKRRNKSSFIIFNLNFEDKNNSNISNGNAGKKSDFNASLNDTVNSKINFSSINKNTKSYGRYRDLDSRESMFDL